MFSRFTILSLIAGACLCTSSAFSASLGDNLLTYWSFDEGAGTAVADSTHNADGILSGGVTWATGADSVFGGALRFDGTNGCVELPPTGPLVTPNASAMTISVRVKCDELITSMPVAYRSIFNSNSGQDYYILYYDKGNSQLRFKVTSQNTTLNSGVSRAVYSSPSASPTLLANTWYHLVAVYDGTDAFLYVNGVKVNTASAANKGAQGVLKNNQYSAIGAKGVTSGQNWKGAMDDLAIWTRALSDSEVASLYSSNQSIKDLLNTPAAADDWSLYY